MHTDEIQRDCPYWFELRDLHGERPAINVTEAAARNSASASKLDGLRKSVRQVKPSGNAVAAAKDSESEDSESESESNSEEDSSSSESEDDAEEKPPAAKKSRVSVDNNKQPLRPRCRSITESELDAFCNSTRSLTPDLDIFVPDPEPIVPVEKTKSVKSEQKPSAPIRRGKDMDGIFEAWKSATVSKQAKLQTRKRKRDDAKAAESLEKMRRDADRADKLQAAEIEMRKQANALAWLEKHMELHGSLVRLRNWLG
jgi:hypothetical protein